MRRSLARWAVVGALTAIGLVGAAQAAQAQAEVQGNNTSEVGAALTGTASGANNSAFGTGPAATASGDAAAQQLGDNSAASRQSGSARTGDPVAGGQVTGAVGSAGIQNQNRGSGNLAVSGTAVAVNNAATDQGPVAESATGAAQAAQVGANASATSQDASAFGGDAVSGSQVTGVAGAQTASIRNQNDSQLNVAVSGAAVAVNILTAQAAPRAVSEGPSTFASHVGPNDAVLVQSSVSESGDSIAGSQVTGAVGTGDLQTPQQNNSQLGLAFGGPAVATASAGVLLGPAASSVDPAGIRSSAQAAQTGDNTLSGEQVSAASTGDAVAGGQVTGLVSSEQGRIEVQNQQSSEADFAFSASSVAATGVTSVLGPQAVTSADAVVVDEVLTDDNVFAVAAGGFASASAAQIGDNRAHVAQSAIADTGDAVAGSQITGAVTGTGGQVDVQTQNTSQLAVAVSGSAVAATIAAITAGPAAASTADAVFAPTITGIDPLADIIVAGGALGGVSSAQASQAGDNGIHIAQSTTVGTGDAVAGSQIGAAVAGDGSRVSIQGHNTAQAGFALSGSGVALPVAAVSAGPVSSASATAVSAPIVEAWQITMLNVALGGDANAQASQAGDNGIGIAQSTTVDTGDAVAGAQVAGAVTGAASEVLIANQNSAQGVVALSGAAIAAPLAVAVAGPRAVADASAVAAPAATVVEGPFTITVPITVGPFTVTLPFIGTVTIPAQTVPVQITVPAPGLLTQIGIAAGGSADAGAAQDGNNVVGIGQSVDVATGDALSGAQVTGVASGAGSRVGVHNQNAAQAAFAVSGTALAVPFTAADAGPVATATATASASPAADGMIVTVLALALGGDANAGAVQAGTNSVDIAQSVSAATGDAVAGSQIAGVVTGPASAVDVQLQHSAQAVLAVTGPALSAPIASVVAGPRAAADSSAAVSPSIAVAGIDTVIPVTVTAGPFQVGPFQVGPFTVQVDVPVQLPGVLTGAWAAIGGTATADAAQIGGNAARIVQTAGSATGDAVAGSQVTGVAAGPGSDVTIQAQGSTSLALAIGGPAVATPAATAAVGPAAFATATAAEAGEVTPTGPVEVLFLGSFALDGSAVARATQVGDNQASFGQLATAASGDAVSASQVTGVVGTRALVSLQQQGELSAAFSLVANAANFVTGNVGPVAVSLGPAFTQQSGASWADVGQEIVSLSGDALTNAQTTGTVV